MSFRVRHPRLSSSSVRLLGPLSSEVTATYLPARASGHALISVGRSSCFVTNHRYGPREPVKVIGSETVIRCASNSKYTDARGDGPGKRRNRTSALSDLGAVGISKGLIRLRRPS